MTDDAATNLSIQSGRADAFFGPHSTGAYKAALTGKTKMVGIGPSVAYVAVTSKKGNGLVNAINAAINGVIVSGEYAQVLERWGEGDERSSAPPSTHRASATSRRSAAARADASTRPANRASAAATYRAR